MEKLRVAIISAGRMTGSTDDEIAQSDVLLPGGGGCHGRGCPRPLDSLAACQVMPVGGCPQADQTYDRAH